MNYIKWPGNNFGDKLNDIIFPSLGIKNCIEFKKPNLSNIPPDTYLGLGTILNKKIRSNVTVLGSGADGVRKPQINLDYKFVRGALTADFLNIDKKFAIGDTAYFLKDYIQNLALNSSKQIKIGIIPHYVNDSILKGDNIISPTLPIKEFIQKVSVCEIVLAEAMHGAICADILRIPWAPISIDSSRYPIQYFKWNDFVSVLGLSIDFGSVDSYQTYLSNDILFNKVCNDVQRCMLGIVNK